MLKYIQTNPYVKEEGCISVIRRLQFTYIYNKNWANRNVTYQPYSTSTQNNLS